MQRVHLCRRIDCHFLEPFEEDASFTHANKVAFFQNPSHRDLIFQGAATLFAATEYNASQRQGSELPSANIDTPPFAANFGNSTNNYISDFRGIARINRLNSDPPCDSLYGTEGGGE